MTKATILSLEQTDVAGLFTIIFEGESQSEFVKFVNKFKDTTKTYEEDEDLNSYVISLQKLDGLLKSDIENGTVRIEKTQIIGVDDKEYNI